MQHILAALYAHFHLLYTYTHFVENFVIASVEANEHFAAVLSRYTIVLTGIHSNGCGTAMTFRNGVNTLIAFAATNFDEGTSAIAGLDTLSAGLVANEVALACWHFCQ